MRNDFYVYVYYDECLPIKLSNSILEFDYKIAYIGKGWGNRFEHMKRFIHLSVKKIFTDLNERQAFFIEAFLIDDIGINNLMNKINGSNSYILNEFEEELDPFEVIEIYGKI